MDRWLWGELAFATLYLRGLPRPFSPSARRWPRVEAALRRADPRDAAEASAALREAGLLDEAALLAAAFGGFSAGAPPEAGGEVALGDAALAALPRCASAVGGAYPRRWVQALGVSAPPAIWGEGDLQSGRWVGIAGSRQPSPAQVEFVREFVAALAVVGAAARGCGSAVEARGRGARGPGFESMPRRPQRSGRGDGSVAAVAPSRAPTEGSAPVAGSAPRALGALSSGAALASRAELASGAALSLGAALTAGPASVFEAASAGGAASASSSANAEGSAFVSVGPAGRGSSSALGERAALGAFASRFGGEGGAQEAPLRAAVQAGFAGVVSGGAPGVDSVAAEAALGAGLSLIEVLPCGLSVPFGRGGAGGPALGVGREGRGSPACPHRPSSPSSGVGCGFREVGGRSTGEGGLQAGREGPVWARLAVASPGAPFEAALAMERNLLLYAAAEATLVVGPRLREGGTWHGAVEALRRRVGPVLVMEDGSPGARALAALGAVPVRTPTEAVEVALARILAGPAQPALCFGG